MGARTVRASRAGRGATGAAPEPSPLPFATLNVGVTGHRAGRLGAENSAAVGTALEMLLARLEAARAAAQAAAHADFAAGGGLRLITMLATGADTLAATAAVAIGAEIQAILPFPRAAYLRDFADGTERETFLGLLARATAAIELPGEAAEGGKAYERGGRLLVGACDVLIAVWDGKESRGRGGTAEIVQYAVDRRRPVFIVAPQMPERIDLFDPDRLFAALQPMTIRDAPRLAGLPEIEPTVARLLAPPHDSDAAGERHIFVTRRQTPRWLRFEYPLLLVMLGLRPLRHADFGVPDVAKTVLEEWDRLDGHLGGFAPALAASRGLLLPRYRRAETLANAYARIWRGSFVSKYALAAVLATASGLLGILLAHAQPFLFAVSWSLNIYILLDGWLGRRRRWRDGWIQFRFLAEELRALRIAFPLALSPQEHELPLDAPEAWPEWVRRRTARDLGLPTLVYDSATVAALAGLLAENELGQQLAYHRANAAFSLKVDRRLGLFSRLAFWGSVAVGVVYAATLLPGVDLGDGLPHIAGGLLTTLPAIGAALAAVRAQADFPRLAGRSARMAKALATLIEALADPRLGYDGLMRAAERGIAILREEARDWKQIIEHKSTQRHKRGRS
jgi:hypothetical protein